MSDRRTVEAVKRDFKEALFAALGRFPEAATPNDRYLALALAVRRQVMRRWVATSETYFKNASRTVCYLSAEFLLGPHLGNNLLNLGLEEEALQAMAELGYDLDAILDQEEEPGPRQRRPRAPGRLLHGLPRHARRSRRSATASATSSGSSTRRSATGGRSSSTDKWLRLGNPWEIAAAGDRLRRCASAATPSGYQRRAGPLPRPLGAAGTSCAACPRRADPRLRGTHGQPAPALEGRGAGVLRLRGLQRGRLLAAPSTRKVDSENITKVLYPNDEIGQGQAAPPRAAVLLRVLLAPGHDPDLPAAARRTSVRLPREGTRSSSTTPTPRIGDRRADAPPRRRARARLGRGVGDHAGAPSPTPTTRCSPRRSRRGRWDVRARRCPAAPGDHLRDQPPLPGRGPGPLPGRPGPSRRPSEPHRRGDGDSASAWPTSRSSAATASTASPRSTPSC